MGPTLAARILGIAVAALLASGAAQAAPAFDARSEFPNHFIPPEHRAAQPADIPAAQVALSRERVEKAVGAVLERITIPVVEPGAKRATQVRYFKYIQEHLSKIDPKARILPSGGVIRATLSYLYDQLHLAAAEMPPVSGETALDRIIAGTGDLAGIEVRGIGSDWDLLLQCEESSFARLQEAALKLTNSAESHYQFRDAKGGIKRSLFVIGDVKPYGDQMRRSVRQGGSTLDFLSYDTAARRFVEPPGLGGIVDDFIRGNYSYIAPADPQHVEDAAKQTVRGIRPLLELPVLSLKDESRLRSELVALLRQAESGQMPGAKAIEQFDKAIRNARYSGAHNRFYRAAPGSVDELVQQAAHAISKRLGRPVIPEFADRFELGNPGRGPSIPAELLMGVDEFAAKHAPDGVLYHGTSSVENGLSILRKGLFISSRDQGTAVY